MPYDLQLNSKKGDWPAKNRFHTYDFSLYLGVNYLISKKKMRSITSFLLSLVFFSCNTNEKSKTTKESTVPERGELSMDSQIFLGNRLFSEKTCITCHDINDQKVGPSVKQIMKVYKEKNGNIVAFLKGESKPMVDTTASQVAIMQANIDGFLQNITDEELNTIATYMMHVDKLNTE